MGARVGGVDRKSSLAAAIGLNARGAMEIVLAVMAFQYGIVRNEFVVAFTSVAVLTSIAVGPVLSRVLVRKKGWGLLSILEKGFVFKRMRGGFSRKDLIREISYLAGEAFGLDGGAIFEEVWRRENSLSTGIGKSVAIPHARMGGINRPYLAVVVLNMGVDFDAPDGNPARLVFFLLTPKGNEVAQLEIMGDIARLLSRKGFLEEVVSSRGKDDFLSLVKTAWGNKG